MELFRAIRIPHPLPKQDATQMGGVFVLAGNKDRDSNRSKCGADERRRRGLDRAEH